MNPDDYCHERMTESPGDWPLIALFAPAGARGAVRALAALLAELQAVVDGPHASDLALPRLAWWRDELARTTRGAPGHPVTRAWWAAVSTRPPEHELLEELIDGTLDGLEGPRAADGDAWALWRFRSGGVPLALALHAAGSALPTREAYALGGDLREVHALAGLAAAITRGRVCLPPDAPEPAAFRSGEPVAREWLLVRAAALRDDLAAHRERVRGMPGTIPARVALALGERRVRHLLAARDPLTVASDDAGFARLFCAWRAATFQS